MAAISQSSGSSQLLIDLVAQCGKRQVAIASVLSVRLESFSTSKQSMDAGLVCMRLANAVLVNC
jgi:hypothetical protein